MTTMKAQWTERADEAQAALEQLFWNPDIKMYNIETPCPNGECNTIFHYWWMAHAVDTLVDGYIRTNDTVYTDRMAEFFEGIVKRNGGALPNDLYDDMEWMAIAWLRACQVTGIDKYKQAVDVLWEDIKTGWNDHMGGGIAWQKSQLDYKNTPANAPAVILAARLHREFGNPEDLEWANKIYRWQKDNLVDPETGFVWDGMNRTGDGSIDKDWKFTYCQGVYIGAGVELYRITGDCGYMDEAIRTAKAAALQLTGAQGVLPPEGTGDGGLFKGIFVRYLTQLIIEAPDQTDLINLLENNATILWENGKSRSAALFGPAWSEPPGEVVPLSTQLSAIKLLECLSLIEAGK